MKGDKSNTILCNNCSLDVTFPNFILGQQPFVNCPRCGCGVFNEWNDLKTAQGQPSKTAPSYKGSVNNNPDRRNSGSSLRGPYRFL